MIAAEPTLEGRSLGSGASELLAFLRSSSSSAHHQILLSNYDSAFEEADLWLVGAQQHGAV
jgi:hypothetical protein